LATTEVVVMEVLAGARDDAHLQRLQGLLLRCELLPLQAFADYEAAAALYRRCRREGESIRRLTDCLIAIPAIRAGAAILHEGKDFDAIARHSALKIA
jgi:predicted nucleic acid-binding protein